MQCEIYIYIYIYMKSFSIHKRNLYYAFIHSRENKERYNWPQFSRWVVLLLNCSLLDRYGRIYSPWNPIEVKNTCYQMKFYQQKSPSRNVIVRNKSHTYNAFHYLKNLVNLITYNLGYLQELRSRKIRKNDEWIRKVEYFPVLRKQSSDFYLPQFLEVPNRVPG